MSRIILLPLLLLALAPLALAAPGCGGQTPTLATHPADGRVFFKGGEPFKGGSIQFTPVGDPSFSVVGAIADDGTFTLYTLKDRAKVAGAPEGEYRVEIMQIPADHKPPIRVTLPRPYKVEAKENHFDIEIPPQKKRR